MPGPSKHHGDGGETRLGSGTRVRKDDARIECVGCIDELSSFLGLAAAALRDHDGVQSMISSLQRVQRELHVLGAELARHDGGGEGIVDVHVASLDREVEALEATLPKLRSFILPGGELAAACLHVARAVCRRAERRVVALSANAAVGPHVIPYLNRLSLVLFLMGRQAAHRFAEGDVPVR